MPRSLVSPHRKRVINSTSEAALIAHRGARAYAPENTLAAFQKAAEIGCSMIELDVHMSRDLHPIVHHDDNLIRCTDITTKFPNRKNYFLSDFNLSELKTLDAGSWYIEQLELPVKKREAYLQDITESEIKTYISQDEINHYCSGNIRIPTLEEALICASELDLIVNVELKTIPRMYKDLTSIVCRLIENLKITESVLISSFDHLQLKEVRSLSSKICTGVLASNRLAMVSDYLKKLDADSYHPGCYGQYDILGFGSTTGDIDSEIFQELRDNSFMTFVWTCNSQEQFFKLMKKNVTGIITDFPNRFL